MMFFHGKCYLIPPPVKSVWVCFSFAYCYFTECLTAMVQNDICVEFNSRRQIDLPKGSHFPVLTSNLSAGMCTQAGFVILQLLLAVNHSPTCKLSAMHKSFSTAQECIQLWDLWLHMENSNCCVHHFTHFFSSFQFESCAKEHNV